MVATVVELRSSAVAVFYYERDGYYARNDPEHRQASFWHGDAAEALGLRAHVRPSRFASVLSGYVPGTDLRLGRMREGQHDHRPGWDITFSAPKSVSLEALVMGDRRVIRAHDEAVRATLDWVEAELLETRGWDPATRRRPRVKAKGMVVAGFRHLASRDQDPQLHTHCVLANMTRTASGGWRSVEPTKIRRSEKLIGAYYREVMARAAALAQIEDLAEDMRRFTDTMLAEHEGHLARDREVRGLVERIRDHWRRWPELGWAASSQGRPVEKLPEYDAWREEGVALLEAGRTRLEADGEAARHLHAMPGGRAGLEGAVETLEHTRLLDGAGRFERAWHKLRERAAENGVPELYAPGYRRVAELGGRLAAAEGLDARARRVAAEWRELDAAQAALAQAVRTLPGRVAAWRERRASDLPQDKPGGLDPDHPARRAWREEGGKLEAEAADMLRREDAHAPYLNAVPGAREGIRQAAEVVRDALRHDRYLAFGWLTAEVVRQARETRTEEFHVPRYGETIARAEALSGQAELPARTQELVATWLEYHAECEPICQQIRDWPARVDALTADYPEPPARLDSLRHWRQRAEPLLAEARAMLVKDGPHARHLDAMPGQREALAEGTSRLDRALLAVEAREMNLLSAVVQRSAEETGGIAFDASGYSGLMDRARSLDARTHLPEGPRNTVQDILARDARWARDRDRVGAFLERAAEVGRARNVRTETDGMVSTPAEQLRAWPDWRRNAEQVLDEAAALRKDIPKHELAAHLGAAGVGQDAVSEREEKIRNRIARDEERRAAAERVRQDRGLSM